MPRRAPPYLPPGALIRLLPWAPSPAHNTPHISAPSAPAAPPSQALMEELAAILDADAEAFVLKLYRMLIYETERSAAGLP